MDNNLLKKLKVLYVEDDDEVMEQMEMFLKKRVGKLITARNGKLGLAEFKENLPDIVISDLKMPIMDGLDMTKEIRKISDVPIIITTAFSDTDIILNAVDADIDNYVVKPLEADEFLRTLEKSAVKALRQKGELIAARRIALTKEKKLEVEENIKNAMAKFIKDRTGKGPKNVKAFISAGAIEIEVVEAFTKFEKTLLESDKNISIVKYNREIFYKDFEEEMKSIINNFLECELSLSSVEIDFLSDKNKIFFKIL